MRKLIKRRQATADLQAFPNTPAILSRLYAARGVTHEEQLQYELKRLLKPSLKGLEAALSLLVTALQENQRIMIVGDFDADGATSTALAMRCLRAFGHRNTEFLVPNRFEYGYGLTPEIVEVAAQRKPDLIITVDNGIASIQGVERAHALGIRVLVTDHHLPGAQLPDADAIVNPNQPGCDFLSKSAAGVGVVFYVMTALRTRLREIGWFNAERPEPNLASFLDLVALGTVADVVPLDFNNRILVAQGLQRMRAGLACPGIRAILSVGGRDWRKISATDLGFVVGPRLNAAGRLDDMSLGIRCLLADNEGEAQALAQELDMLNRDRRAIEAVMQKEAAANLEAMLVSMQGELPSGICLYREDWHQGVIGILASRIKDRWHRPVIVFADDEHGALKGSGRSIPGLHLRDILDEVATQHPGLLTKFGGHAMAAGLSLEKHHLELFSQAFASVVARHLGDRGLEPVIESDGELQADDFTLALAQQLEEGGPWGQAFPEPVFDGQFHVVNQKVVGEKHLKLVLAPASRPDMVVDAIVFNIDRAQWPNPNCQKVIAAYKLAVNEFRGTRSVQLMVDYLESC
ncbi:single-stranded-DNA-specific exonuclease RecJ [Saccharophagus sp. K07]|jgi:single-stranded-DNA-specific exonuclease|uniref:single-stranded-DNA-specific exonuclease RecJ n=1 Tax=Saccharophagus sp. K07 TaxID=2283636 RepID=UPI0016523AF8|nr:single-stranded-DNA-specific exonuclease RecJ [Saccharophagus sp. K07]MBC6903870.1 single-stranded-DNA-specific exonuclease RecJ [Saccharophagus sp. K07]